MKIFCLFFIIIHFYVSATESDKPLQTRCARIKLKADCVDETRNWFNTMMLRKSEVLEILKEQGVYVESVFLDQINEDYYLIYFMKEENTQKSLAISSQSTHPINEAHKQYKKKCWEGKKILEPLLDLDRIPH